MDEIDQIRLFGSASLFGYLKSRQQSATNSVEQIPRDELLATRPDALVGQIVAQWSVAPLVLLMEQMQRQQSEIKISKVVDATDYGMPVKREVMVRGKMMTYLIPFTGDPQLWLLTAIPELIYTGALDAERRILTLTLRSTNDVESSWYQRQMEERMSQIEVRIQSQSSELKQHHDSLTAAVGRAVARRREQVQA